MARQQNRHSLLRLVVTLALAFLSLPLLQSPASAAVIGGFEIDGNLVVDGGGLDWNSPSVQPQPVTTDPIENDPSVYGQGSKEDDPPAWADDGSQQAPAKSDLGKIYSYSHINGGDLWAFFGFERESNNGTTFYSIELNQLPNTVNAQGVSVPNRSAGDVLFNISQQGSGEFAFLGGFIYPYSFDDLNPDIPAQDVPGATSADGLFGEIALNLSDLIGIEPGCPPARDFSVLNVRTRSSDAINSALKDYVAPITFNTPSTCGKVEIRKTVNGTTPADATFMISPDPTPGSNAPFLVVSTGADGVYQLNQAEPGTYEVRELAPPDGYLLPADATDSITVTAGQGADIATFDDVLGDVRFTKSYEGTPPTGCGATFTLTRTQKWSFDITPPTIDLPSLVAAAGPSIEVTDNCTNDEDNTLGEIAVSDLVAGKWTIDEDSAPAGWIPDADTVDFTVGPTDAAAERSISLNPTGNPATFQDPLRKITIEVLKTESVPGVPGDGKPLAGVTFELYADNNGAPGALVDTDVTDADGRILFTGLSWQQDYWLKEIKKAGYEIGLSPNPKLIDINQANPPTNNSTVITVNVDNPREEVSIKLNKVDGTDQSPLNGGKFDLYRESNNTAGLQIGSDTKVNGSPETLVNGSLTFDKSEYQIPWGYTYYVYEAEAPPLYGLMTPNPIVVVTTEGQADTTITLNATDPRLPGHYTLAKTSDPPTGSVVNAGTDVTYTLHVVNNSDGVVEGAVVTDDLSNVVNNASDPFAIGAGGSYDAATKLLTWNVPTLQPGDDATLTYKVTIDADAWGVTLTNVATPDDDGACINACSTTHYTPKWELTKTSDPVSGTVQAGTDITYTLTVENTGPAVLTGATVSDTITGVPTFADLVLPLSAGLSTVGANGISWAVPDVAVGGSVSVNYTIHIHADAWGKTIGNHATPDQPSGECVNDCTTTHHTPKWELTKTSDPVSGVVNAGTDIVYTLQVTNTSLADVKGATVSDTITGVPDLATLVTPLAAGLTTVGANGLQWAVPDLAPGQSATVSYTVHIKDDSWGVTIGNHATPDQPSGTCVNGCTTQHQTPHYTLKKESTPASGSTVNPGDLVVYKLTVTNDGPVPITSATINDNLIDLAGKATLQVPLNAGLTLTATGLQWAVPVPLAPGASVSVEYTVQVNAGAWNVAFKNVATPGDAYGDCVTVGGCTTNHKTPPVTTLVIKKVDMERTDLVLAGATFTLWQDNEFDANAPAVVGPEDTLLGSSITGPDGLAKFPNLRPGHYLVKETVAPAGYDLLKVDTIKVEIVEGDGGNFVANGEMAPIVFRDPGQGQIAIVAKRQFELINGQWVESDGRVNYGDTVRYVVSVQATGNKMFHDVRVSDYVPGYNPVDGTSTAKATLVPGSAVCTGSLNCTVTVGADNKVVWHAGSVVGASGSVEMQVKFPSLPSPIPFDSNNEFNTTLWNEGYLDYFEVNPTTVTPVPARAALGRAVTAAEALPMVAQHLESNEVIVRATVKNQVLPNEGKKPKPQVLPATGVSGEVQALGLLGALGVMVGGVLMLAGRRTRENG